MSVSVRYNDRWLNWAELSERNAVPTTQTRHRRQTTVTSSSNKLNVPSLTLLVCKAAAVADTSFLKYTNQELYEACNTY